MGEPIDPRAQVQIEEFQRRMEETGKLYQFAAIVVAAERMRRDQEVLLRRQKRVSFIERASHVIQHLFFEPSQGDRKQSVERPTVIVVPSGDDRIYPDKEG